MQTSESEIRQRVHAYLTKSLTLEDFEEWFVSATWDDRLDVGQESLIADITALLTELRAGVITETEFCTQLQGYVPTWTVASLAVVTGWTGGLERSPFTLGQGVVAGRSHGAAFG